jgi:putative transport protein
MPTAANSLFRDFGLAVFLACVGLTAGQNFIERAFHNVGLTILIAGLALTILPVFIVACWCRLVLKMNFVTLAGWVAGTMTNSPSLIFSEESCRSTSPAVTYAAIAPLATLVPIICAQVLAIMG